MNLSTGPKPSLDALSFVWDVIFSIAIPTTLFALLGRWLDQRWHTSPWMTILGLILALGLAFVLVMRKAKQFLATLPKKIPPK